MTIEILMPALSPTMTEGKLAKWLKKEGDAIKSGDLIAEIETDKATMEMEAVDEGTLGKILVAAGTEKVSVNQPIAVLLQEGESAKDIKASAPTSKSEPPKAETPKAEAPKAAPPPAPAKPAPAAPQAAAPTPPPAAPAAPPMAPAAQTGDRVFASPLARRVAATAGIDIAAVTGSGPRGRIVKADVDAAVASGGVKRTTTTTATGAPAPRATSGTVDEYGQPYTIQPNNNIRKVIAKRLVEAKTTIPHFYLTIDCVIDELAKARKRINENADGYKLSVNDFVIKASAIALRKVPQVNASWTEDAVRLYDNVDISIAVATPDGLITPIIRDADKKSLSVISNEMKDLAARAKVKKLKLDEFQGGGFSISNLGMFGIKDFSAIINPPQVAILAVGAGEQRTIVRDGQIVIAEVMSCSLSCDHRVVDGAVGAQFMQAFKALIEDPIRMLV